MKIYLIGYMGSGKTTAGRQLAKKMSYQFNDLDATIEECAHYSISDIFKKFDEKAFRQLEKKVLHQTQSLRNTIISTGGGTPCYKDNMEWINKNGISVYLKLSPKSLAHRILNSKKKRPIVEGKDPEELLEFISKHLKERETYYWKANIVVKGENLNVNALHHTIKQRLKNHTR